MYYLKLYIGKIWLLLRKPYNTCATSSKLMKVIRKQIWLASFLIYCITVSAQIKSVKGTLCDFRNHHRIPYATVVLHALADSGFVSATATDSLGRFQLNIKGQDKYYLQISHIEYEDTIVKVLSDKDMGILYLQPKSRQLDEVVVTANPILTVDNGILKYNAQVLFKDQPVTNARQMLEKLPGIYNVGGRLSLIGVAGLTVLVNGKLHAMNQEQLDNYLEQIKSSDVKNIELIYNAPPQYHAKGAVVNIVTKESWTEKGVTRLQGEADAQYAIQHYTGGNIGGALLYATHNLSLGVNYKYVNRKERTGMNIDSYHDLSGVNYPVEQKNRGWIKNHVHMAFMDLNYKTDKNMLSVSYNTQITPNGNILEESVNNFSTSTNFSNKTKYLHNVSLDYAFNTLFKVGIYYTSYVNNSSQHFDAFIANKGQSFISKAKQNLNIVDGYVDGRNNLMNKWIISYGGKFKYTRDEDVQNYTVVIGDKPVEDTNSNVNEFIATFYTGIEKKFADNLTLSVSFTGEYSKFTDESDFALFPQLNLSYIPSPQHTFQVSFSSNKTYPSYWERQDFIGFFDGYTQVHGNTALKPYNTYSANLTYMLKQKYIFSFYHVNQPSFFAQQAYQACDELTLLYQTQNWKYNRVTGINVMIPFRIGKRMTSRFTVNSFYQHVRSDQFYDIRFDRHRFSHFFASDNTYRLSSKPAISLSLSGYYGVNMIHGIYCISNPFNFNFGVKWSFWHDKATVVLKASDLFNQSVPDMNVNYAGQRFNLDLLPDSRCVTISFNYSFGSYKKKESKKIDTSRFK